MADRARRPRDAETIARAFVARTMPLSSYPVTIIRAVTRLLRARERELVRIVERYELAPTKDSRLSDIRRIVYVQARRNAADAIRAHVRAGRRPARKGK